MPPASITPERVLQHLDWRVIRRLDGLLPGDYRTLFYGPGVVTVGMKNPPRLSPQLTDILHAIDYGGSRPEETLTGRMGPGEVLAGLTELEMLGLVRRDEAGGYERVAP